MLGSFSYDGIFIINEPTQNHFTMRYHYTFIPSLLFVQLLSLGRCEAQSKPGLPLGSASVPLAHDHDQMIVGQERVIAPQHTDAIWSVKGGGSRSLYTIPVVVHVIHNNGPENISEAQIIDGIEQLNLHYNRQNAGWTTVNPAFLDLVADVSIRFELAKTDPDGNCTNGITRTESPLTTNGAGEMQFLIQWPRDQYMNFWICADPLGSSGYSNFPSDLSEPLLDGVVVRHNYFGRIGTSSANNSTVPTLLTGFWLDLRMTNGGSAGTAGDPGNCALDDFVDDTPNTVGWTSCSVNGSSCGSLDNVENFMETNFQCGKMFTVGQAERMIAALTSPVAQRNSLITPQNLAATGVDGPGELCIARFSSSRREVCQDSPVNFIDQSYHNVTERTWEFPGGTPAISTAPTVEVSYAQAGTYPVTLTVSDGTNSLSTSVTGMITVHPSPGADIPLLEGFEEYSDLADAPWTLPAPAPSPSFELTNTASHSGDQSVRLENTADMAGTFHNLHSSTYDMSDVSEVTISFRYAFARRSSTNDDRLRFYVSNDCGQTWSMRQQLRGSTNLSTASDHTGDFIPENLDEWGLATVSNISAAYHTANFRIRFEFESDGGNNLYIDDININNAGVGIAEVQDGGGMLSVFPNPAQQDARLEFTVTRSGTVRVDLLDVLGRTVDVLSEQGLPAGRHSMPFSLVGLGNGTYIIRVQETGSTRTERFVVDR